MTDDTTDPATVAAEADEAATSSGTAPLERDLLAPLDADDPALRDAPVRIHCPREVRCLWAGPTLPDLSVHPDPAAEVREAAGCLADPPTCPCAVAEQNAAATSGGAAGTGDGDRDAIDTVAARAGVSLPEPIATLRPALGVPAALGPGLGVGMGGRPGTLSASVADTAAPPMLLTAQAHGLAGNGRPAPDPVAFGGDVAGVLDALGFDPTAVHTVLMGRSEPERDDSLDTPRDDDGDNGGDDGGDDGGELGETAGDAPDDHGA